MILYLDSSSIVKLYVDEDHSNETRQVVATASRVSSTILAYVEVRAALARQRRERRIRTERSYNQVLDTFLADWRDYHSIPTSDEVVERAGDLAADHALSGYDAVHLASAIRLRRGTAEEVRFSTWDGRLARAARSEGLPLAHEVTA